MISRGLYVGRFQPPHLGHLEVIKDILTKHDEILIVVAAAQISHTVKNPLSAGERLLLLKTMLDNTKIDPKTYWLIPAADIFDNLLWVHHISRLVPPFEVFYTNNPFTKLLFEDAGHKTANTSIFDREELEGSKIRGAIMNGKEINGVLDEDVKKMLTTWNIEKRLLATVDSTKREQRGTELVKDT
ncbi:MAG: nicotinamide-nucleotide adenylyltransferase [Candidatus Heimdallarchaeota archaeon]|nr:nicotinamide-nucleotide adenylyltransferase [Candidatus Heimdallarchaeota archaeon]